jgi:hypothetical protein
MLRFQFKNPSRADDVQLGIFKALLRKSINKYWQFLFSNTSLSVPVKNDKQQTD